MIRKHYFLVLINIRLLMLQAVHYREFAHVEQVAAVGLVFQIWKDPEPPQFAHGGLRKLVSQQQDLACSGSCSVLEIWTMSVSKPPLAYLQMQVLRYTGKIQGVESSLIVF